MRAFGRKAEIVSLDESMKPTFIETIMSKRFNPNETAVLALASEVRLIAGKLKRNLRAHGSLGDLAPSQVAVALRLDRDGPTTVSDLARAEGVRPQLMGATIAALQAEGFVRGTPDPNDGRQTILALTKGCRYQIAGARVARADWLHRAIGSELSPVEQRQLARGLALLNRVLDH
jgi:DNA-binding MarR family transcriptional regulator